jgi:hypothetical protein
LLEQVHVHCLPCVSHPTHASYYAALKYSLSHSTLSSPATKFLKPHLKFKPCCNVSVICFC